MRKGYISPDSILLCTYVYMHGLANLFFGESPELQGKSDVLLLSPIPKLYLCFCINTA